MQNPFNLFYSPKCNCDVIHIIAIEGGKYVVQLKKEETLLPLKNKHGIPMRFKSLSDIKLATKHITYNLAVLSHASSHVELVGHESPNDHHMCLPLHW